MITNDTQKDCVTLIFVSDISTQYVIFATGILSGAKA